MKVLVVDDSVVYRTQIKSAISGAAFVDSVQTANNGKVALGKIAQNDFDLVLLDLEMPEMDGLETLRALRKDGNRIRIIMFSSQTKRGSEKTLQCLNEGADDFVAKPTGDALSMTSAGDAIKDALIPKLRQFIVGSSTVPSRDVSTVSTASAVDKPRIKAKYVYNGKHDIVTYVKKEVDFFRPNILVIGSSTGGPAALEVALADLGEVSIPLLVTQHMPPVFTASLAKRLELVSGCKCAEGIHGETIENKIYIAPGNFHMSVANIGGSMKIQLDQRERRNSVRPAVDYLFESAAELVGPKLQGIILTGMGEDGCEGSMALKKASGGMIIQTEESCVVFGMPGAVQSVNAYDAKMDLKEINAWIRSHCTVR